MSAALAPWSIREPESSLFLQGLVLAKLADFETDTAVSASKVLPVFRGDVGLLENTAERANRNLMLPRHDCRIDNQTPAAGQTSRDYPSG
jgi:hypothetical protein